MVKYIAVFPLIAADIREVELISLDPKVAPSSVKTAPKIGEVTSGLPTNVAQLGLVEFSGKPTICGFWDLDAGSLVSYPICVQYDYGANTFGQLPAMPSPHIEGAFGVMDGQLWATGGITDDWYGGSFVLDYLDKEDNIWKTYTLDSMPKKLKFHKWITISNSEAIIMGGYDLQNGPGSNFNDEVFLFSPASGNLEV